MSTRAAAVLALAAGMAPAAHADRPLASETADAAAAGECEIDAVWARDATRAAPSVRTLGAVLSCGTRGSTEWAIGGASARGGESFRAALLGGKTTLLAPEGGTAFGLAYSVSASNASGTWRREDFTLLGVASRALGSGLKAHLNLGWQRGRGGVDTTLWSAGVETTGATVFAADLFGDDRGRPTLSAGIGRAITPALFVSAAYAVQRDTPRVRQWSLGAKLAF